MNAECIRIADQLRRAFHGEAWHGDSVGELLAGVSAEQALQRPLVPAHTIWELVLHIRAWVNAASEAVQGTPLPTIVGTEADWPGIPDKSEAAWSRATADLFRSAERLAGAIEGFGDGKLHDTVPGRPYDFYYLFHGIVQHSLYHGGQIALLIRAVAR
ncbi:MAG TPA: DinB family protein [Bryobacteraceae bacterium]|jgi:uncharacterized damage-inducible protein DinB